jgi:hypothetical protein
MHNATQRRLSNRPGKDVWAAIGDIPDGNAIGVEQKLGMRI